MTLKTERKSGEGNVIPLIFKHLRKIYELN